MWEKKMQKMTFDARVKTTLHAGNIWDEFGQKNVP